ncbi:MAG: DUF3127 domain-containing protein [Chitinophagaceae bacterium]|nr:DUF3127 domain-containing protein [Chitinophagaceae bacterium]MCW5928976.1 DUF3127 domain-containing protein [Chitinophagaceae bacterium]
MSYEMTGKLIARYETVQRTASFKTREFVVEKTDDIGGKSITNYAKFQCVQDKTALPDRFSIGETVKVYFNIKGSRWEKNGQVNYITNLDAWRMESVNLNTTATAPESQVEGPADTGFSAVEDDLPF